MTAATKDRAAEVKAITDGLQAKVASLTTSEEWQHHLDIAARFHNYSPFNVLFLAFQAAEREVDLTRVAGFRAWQKMGRQVRKGEKSFKVLAPARYKTTDEATGEEQWSLRGFTTASVFDVSQTDGEPLVDVSPMLLVDGGEQGILDAAVALIRAEGYAFERAPVATLGTALGRTMFSATTVLVRDDVALAQAIKTTVHELAHVYLHDPQSPDHRQITRDRCEVEAESVAYVVLTHLGIAADDYSLPYIAVWADGNPEAVRTTADVVIKTAHRIIESLTITQPTEQE